MLITRASISAKRPMSYARHLPETCPGTITADTDSLAAASDSATLQRGPKRIICTPEAQQCSEFDLRAYSAIRLGLITE